MPLPLTTTTAAEAYAAIRVVGQSMHLRCDQLAAQLATGIVYPAFLLDIAEAATAGVVEVMAMRSVPGLGAYASAQLGVPDLDLTSSLTEAVMALAALSAAIVAEYPKTADGILADRSFAPNGQVLWVTIDAASLPQTAAAATAFVATLT